MELKPDYENTPQQQQQQQQQQQKQQQEEEGDLEKLEKHQQQQQKQKQKHVFHVLAVDDSLIDRKLLEKLLGVSSYKVTCVDSGDKALEYLGLLDNVENNSTVSASAFSSSHSPQQEGLRVNLIMTDFCMPGMSGYDLLKKVKGSSWKDVPVVIMSSENVPARISMCLEGGAEEFLLKPLQLSDLDKLETYLLKSLNQNMDNNEFNGNNSENRNNESNGNNNNEINNFKSNNGSFSKRKALSAETQERRPKMKELAVV